MPEETDRDGAPAQLIIKGPHSQWSQDLAADEAVIGRAGSSDVVLAGTEVSRHHARILRDHETFRIEDLGSANGTFVNGRRVDRAPIGPQDRIRVGPYELTIALQAEVTASTPVRPVAADSFRECRTTIHKLLLERMNLKRAAVEHTDDHALRAKVAAVVETILGEIGDSLPAGADRVRLAKLVVDEVVGLGPLEDLLRDPSVTEIMVNGPGTIYVERNGRLELTDLTFSDDEHVRAVIERIVAPLGRRIDESSPLVDARLKDGSRVNAIIPPLVLNGPVLTIRKFSAVPYTADDLVRMGTLTADVAAFLRLCVLARQSLVISGGTGSGKTTLLNVLSSFIPPDERIVTIEDAAELRLSQPHVISLETRPPNIEHQGAVAIRDLVRNALRMRPDRIIVGECRGGEAFDMLQAMNTGHDGSLTTVHANSPRDAMARIETMVLMAGMDLPVRAIREQTAAAIQVIVQQSRMSDGSRRLTHVAEVTGIEGERIVLQDIYHFMREGTGPDGRILGGLRPTGFIPRLVERLRERGLDPPLELFKESGPGGRT